MCGMDGWARVVRCFAKPYSWRAGLSGARKVYREQDPQDFGTVGVGGVGYSSECALLTQEGRAWS